MKSNPHIKFSPDGDGGGTTTQTTQTSTTPDWRASIPEDIRTEPMFKDIKDIPSLAKSYMAAQRLIGTDKIAKPSDKWKPEQWSEFYDSTGRPKTPEDYSFKIENLPEGMTVEPAKLANVRKVLHEQGLSDKQAAGVIGMYLGSLKEQTEGYKTAQAQVQQTAMQELSKVWGNDVAVKLDVAKGVIKKFGGEALSAKLEQTGMGNDPEFIQMLAKMGEAMLDDSAKGEGSGIILGDITSAKREIDQLKVDGKFQGELGDRRAPGHKAALDRWTKLHELAYPAK